MTDLFQVGLLPVEETWVELTQPAQAAEDGRDIVDRGDHEQRAQGLASHPNADRSRLLESRNQDTFPEDDVDADGASAEPPLQLVQDPDHVIASSSPERALAPAELEGRAVLPPECPHGITIARRGPAVHCQRILLVRPPFPRYDPRVERPATDRERIRQLLEEGSHDLYSLAELLELKVTVVEEEVGHAVRSSGLKLKITPAECEACGFVFRDRSRLSSPSRCPKCKSERITSPTFTLR